MVKRDEKIWRHSKAPHQEHRVPSHTPIPRPSRSQHEPEVSTAPRNCIPAFTHPPGNLGPPRWRSLSHQLPARRLSAPGDHSGSGGHGLRRTPSFRLSTLRLPHTQPSFTVSVSLRVAHTLELPSHPQFFSSHSGFFPSHTHTHAGSPSHSLSRSFLFHTHTLRVLHTHKTTQALSHTSERASERARARPPHTAVGSRLHAPGVLLSAAASLPRPPPHAVSGPHPARGDGGRAERSVAARTARTEPEPAPDGTRGSLSPPGSHQ